MKTSALFKGLPVVMYHSVNTEHISLSTNPSVFEAQCKAMINHGWHTLALEEAEDYFINSAPLPKKSVWLTFDDGFLDNYVYAYPILEKYGLKATMFTILNRVEEGSPRPTFKDVWQGKKSIAELPPVDYPFTHDPATGFKKRFLPFVNWEEIYLMEKNGVMQIAPHSLYHERLIARPRYKGFYKPEDSTLVFDELKQDFFWGMPRFKLLPVLGSPRFIPSPRLIEGITSLVPQTQKGAIEFFKNPALVKKLEDFVRSFSKSEIGKFENDEDFHNRIEHELSECQAIMERRLGRKALTFCWPWGKFCAKSMEYAKKAGFKVFVTTKRGGNYPGRPEKVCRFALHFPTDGKKILKAINFFSYTLLAGIYGFLRPKLRKLKILK